MSWITFKEKQEQRAKLIHDAGELLKTAKKEERELTPDENTRFEQMHTDADRLANEVEQLRKQDQPSEVSKPVSVENQSKHRGRKNCRHRRHLPQVDLWRQGCIEFRRTGHTRHHTAEKRAVSGMSAATSGAGAEFVPQGFADRFFAKLKYYGGVRQAGPPCFLRLQEIRSLYHCSTMHPTPAS